MPIFPSKLFVIEILIIYEDFVSFNMHLNISLQRTNKAFASTSTGEVFIF